MKGKISQESHDSKKFIIIVEKQFYAQTRTFTASSLSDVNMVCARTMLKRQLCALKIQISLNLDEN